MRHSLVPLVRGATAGVLAIAAMWSSGGLPAAAPAAAPAPEASSLSFDQRYRALQHGGIVRAANTSITCRASETGCSAAQDGRGVNGDFDMFYVDVDRDPNTYNSSRAQIRLPSGSRVTYARLYWGGNLRVGEQKPAEDNGRVLIAEPGGEYKQVVADTVVGHRVTDDVDAFQASADVTGLVRDSGAGLYTVAQVNVASGRSAAGAWGGWTLVVAYENAAEPLRHLALWDGFAPVQSGGQELRLRDAAFPAGAGGHAGVVAYNGDRRTTGDSLVVTTGQSGSESDSIELTDSANPYGDVLNSTISEPRSMSSSREPAYPHTLGYDSDVFGLGGGWRRAGDQVTLRLRSQRDAAWAGALFAAVDARQ